MSLALNGLSGHLLPLTEAARCETSIRQEHWTVLDNTRTTVTAKAATRTIGGTTTEPV
jgi:hypothetical protein